MRNYKDIFFPPWDILDLIQVYVPHVLSPGHFRCLITYFSMRYGLFHGWIVIEGNKRNFFCSKSALIFKAGRFLEMRTELRLWSRKKSMYSFFFFLIYALWFHCCVYFVVVFSHMIGSIEMCESFTCISNGNRAGQNVFEILHFICVLIAVAK